VSSVPALPMIPPPPASLPTTPLAPPVGDSRLYIATLLGVPHAMMDRSDKSLRRCYQQYLAYLDMIQKLDQMMEAGTWPGKRPLKAELVEVFVARTTWFDYYEKTFPLLNQHSDVKL
jgi:hypothetical protein